MYQNQYPFLYPNATQQPMVVQQAPPVQQQQEMLAHVQQYITQAVNKELNSLLAPHLEQYNKSQAPVQQVQQKETPDPIGQNERMLLQLFHEFLKEDEESGKALVSGLSRFSRYTQSKLSS